jgi:hypothetical protein
MLNCASLAYAGTFVEQGLSLVEVFLDYGLIQKHWMSRSQNDGMIGTLDRSITISFVLVLRILR